MELSKKFDYLDLDDTFVQRIVRKDRKITIFLNGALIYKEHPDSQGMNLSVEKGRLVFYDVDSEETGLWDDSIKAKPHPNPKRPLDIIVNFRFEGSRFYLGGMRNVGPNAWYEWIIKSEGYKFYADEFKRNDS